MNRWILIFIIVVASLGGCMGEKGKELFETARFEEQQHNLPHARQLYEELVVKYPGSEYASRGAARLREIQGK